MMEVALLAALGTFKGFLIVKLLKNIFWLSTGNIESYRVGRFVVRIASILLLTTAALFVSRQIELLPFVKLSIFALAAAVPLSLAGYNIWRRIQQVLS